jgi:hypothetical protein
MDPSQTAFQLTTSAVELNKIDRLRECGVAQYIGLPQVSCNKVIFHCMLTCFACSWLWLEINLGMLRNESDNIYWQEFSQ